MEPDTTTHDQGLCCVDKVWTEQPGQFSVTQSLLSTGTGGYARVSLGAEETNG